MQKVLIWMGGVLLGAAALVLLFAFTYIRYGPQQGRKGEAEVTVVGIQEKPAGSAPEVVAVARVTIENEPILIPLTEERRAEVEAGAHLRVEYTVFPRTGRVRVDAWRVEP